jgi:hypothetical protein
MTAASLKLEQRRAEVARLQGELAQVEERLSTSAQREEDAAYAALRRSLVRPATAVDGQVQKIRRERERDRAAVDGLRRDIAAHQRIIREADDVEQTKRNADALNERDRLKEQVAASIADSFAAFTAFYEAWLAMAGTTRAAIEYGRIHPELGPINVGLPYSSWIPGDFASLFRWFHQMTFGVGSLGEAKPDALIARLAAESNVDLRDVVIPAERELPIQTSHLRNMNELTQVGAGSRGSFQNPYPVGHDADLPASPEAATLVAARGVLEDILAD